MTYSKVFYLVALNLLINNTICLEMIKWFTLTQKKPAEKKRREKMFEGNQVDTIVSL